MEPLFRLWQPLYRGHRQRLFLPVKFAACPSTGWELARMSPRVQASFSYLVAESLPPSQLDTSWFPLQHLKNIDEFHGYLGIAPLMLSLVACFWGRKKIIYFFAGWGLLSAVLSLGSFTPVYPFLLEYFPGFSLFRVPSRWLLLTDFSWALVSGFGIGLLGEKDRTPRWFPWLLFLLAAAALTGWLMSLNLIPAWLTDLKRNPGPYRRLFLFFLLSVLVLALIGPAQCEVCFNAERSAEPGQRVLWGVFGRPGGIGKLFSGKVPPSPDKKNPGGFQFGLRPGYPPGTGSGPSYGLPGSAESIGFSIAGRKGNGGMVHRAVRRTKTGAARISPFV
jgi:hypothetical protein